MHPEDMKKLQHMRRHQELHKMLDELLADFINITGKFPSNTTVMELLAWSAKQANNPDESPNNVLGLS